MGCYEWELSGEFHSTSLRLLFRTLTILVVEPGSSLAVRAISSQHLYYLWYLSNGARIFRRAGALMLISRKIHSF